jgi:hypothetical protein
MSIEWIVEDVRRSHVVYREGKHVAWIPGEILSGGYNQPDFALYPKSFTKWNPPHSDEKIDESKKEEIIKRVCVALKAQGLKTEVDW